MSGLVSTKSGFLSGITRNVLVLGAVSLLTDVSSEMTLTILPLFLANVLLVPTAIIGIIEGVAETTASVTKVFSGWLSDRTGQRKWLTVLGYGLSAVSKPFLFFAAAWPLVFGARFADRLGKGIRTAPRDALIADSAAPDKAGLNFGFHRAADTAGAVIGLTLAAIVVYLSEGGSLLLDRPTYQILVLVGIIPGLLAVLILATLVTEQKRSAKEAKPPSLSLKGFDVRFKMFVVIVILFTLGNSSDAFLILRAQNLGMSVLTIFVLLVTFNLVYTVAATPAGALSDILGRRRLVVAGWSAYGLVYLGFAVAEQSWHVWLLYLLYGLYYASVEGASRALVADTVAPEQRGTAYGVYNAAVGVAALPASIIAGILWQGIGAFNGFGPSAPFYFGAAMAFLAVLLLVMWLPTLPKAGK